MNWIGLECLKTCLLYWIWFDGCCECVGSTCINFGINESKCFNCPETNDDPDMEELFDEDWRDYGEGVGPLDDVSNSNL